MGENRSNIRLGLSGVVKFAFISLLLSSVCFPQGVMAEINDGTELRTALLNGDTTIKITGIGAPMSFTVPNPGQEFIFESELWDPHKTWLEMDNADLTFMGDVTFQSAKFVQDADSFDEFFLGASLVETRLSYATDKSFGDFFGGAIHNNGDLSFVGQGISFVDNAIHAGTQWSENNKKDVRGRGAGLYNEKSVTVAADTKINFSGNKIITGAYTGGAVDDGKSWMDSLSQGAGFYNEGTANILGAATFTNNYVGQLWVDSRADAFSDGAGLYNAKDIVFGKSVIFTGNVAEKPWSWCL